MVVKAVERFEPEWAFAAVFIMVLALGKWRPGIADSLATWLKECHNCYNDIECQFFNYFRQAP